MLTRLFLLMQERLTFGSLAEKGSFFLIAGNAPSSYAGRALSSNARKASSYAGKAHFLNAERLTFSVVWLGKAQFLSIEKAHFRILNAERLNAGKALYPFL